MIHKIQLREQLIIPALKQAAKYDPKMFSVSAINLLMGTAYKESLAGDYIRQFPSGPARGIMQIEVSTHADMRRWIIAKGPKAIQLLIEDLISPGLTPEESLMYNLLYNIVIARVKYWTIPAPLPSEKDSKGMAEYWGRYYNTRFEEKGMKEFERLFNEYVLTSY